MHNPLETDYDLACERLSQDLGLKYFSEDWGLCNQDPARLGEFVEYFITRRDELSETEQGILGELIMASADKGLVRNPSFDLSSFRKFVKLTRDDPAQSDNFDLFGEDVGTPEDPTPLAAVIQAIMSR